MIIIRDPTSTSTINDPDIFSLVSTRFAQILSGELYDYDQHGYMIVVESCDSIADLEAETNCPLLNPNDSDFMPYFEALEEHDCCFEMLFILNDDGFAITIFIPKQSSINADLLKLCGEYAVPATAK